jgi:hypothetical protein
MRYEYTDTTGRNHNLYATDPLDTESKGTLVESVTGYALNGMEERYVFTDYRGDTPVATTVTTTYFNKTVTF